MTLRKRTKQQNHLKTLLNIIQCPDKWTKMHIKLGVPLTSGGVVPECPTVAMYGPVNKKHGQPVEKTDGWLSDLG